MREIFLGLDGGASATKWSACDRYGEIFAEGKSQAIDGHIYREESRVKLIEVLTEIKSSLDGEVKSLYGAITGVQSGKSEDQRVFELIREIFPSAKIEIDIDVALGYRANFDKSEGIYLYAGTGSVAVLRNSNQELITLGGWGYLLGDEGAGYWIGIQGIRQALFDIENNRSSALRNLISGQAGGDNWDSIKSYVYSQPRGVMATLALPILQLADTGDSEAKNIKSQASQELIKLAYRARRFIKDESAKIIFAGGISKSSITQDLIEEFGATLEVSQVDLAYKAALIARDNYRSD